MKYKEKKGMTHNFINEEMALATKLNTPKKERNISRPLVNLFYAIDVVSKRISCRS